MKKIFKSTLCSNEKTIKNINHHNKIRKEKQSSIEKCSDTDLKIENIVMKI